MPVYLHLANLLIDKKAVIERYDGGLEQFRIDYKIGGDNYNQEDNHLFSVAKMNIDELDIDRLVAKGLQYDYDLERSDDFTIVGRYDTYLWSTNWVRDNKMFAWHIDTPEVQINKAETIANLTMDVIEKMFDNGEDPFGTIK